MSDEYIETVSERYIELYEKMAETVKIYNEADQKERLIEIFKNYQKESLDSLNENLDKLQQVVEQTK